MVGKLFYNVQCPICDARNQSLSWLVATQGEGTTKGGMLKGTPPLDLIGEVFEGIQVVAQGTEAQVFQGDDDHPRQLGQDHRWDEPGKSR